MSELNQSFIDELTPEEQEDKMKLEIDERARKTEEDIRKRFSQIFRKGIKSFTQEDKAFLQARRSYLTKGQAEELADVLKEDLTKKVSKSEEKRIETQKKSDTPEKSEFDKLMEKGRSSLNDLAREAGLEDPESFPNKEKLVEAILAISPQV